MHTRGEESHNTFSCQKKQKSVGTEKSPLSPGLAGLGCSRLVRERARKEHRDSMGQRGGAGDSLHGHSPSARPETQAQQGEWALGVQINPQSPSHPHCKPLV